MRSIPPSAQQAVTTTLGVAAACAAIAAVIIVGLSMREDPPPPSAALTTAAQQDEEYLSRVSAYAESLRADQHIIATDAELIDFGRTVCYTVDNEQLTVAEARQIVVDQAYPRFLDEMNGMFDVALEVYCPDFQS